MRDNYKLINLLSISPTELFLDAFKFLFFCFAMFCWLFWFHLIQEKYTAKVLVGGGFVKHIGSQSVEWYCKELWVALCSQIFSLLITFIHLNHEKQWGLSAVSYSPPPSSFMVQISLPVLFLCNQADVLCVSQILIGQGERLRKLQPVFQCHWLYGLLFFVL